MKSLPTLTDEQRKAALAKAAQVRAERAQLRVKLENRSLTFADVLDSDDVVVGATRVSYVLESLPRIGKATAEVIMRECEIAENRRVRSLGRNQRERLLADRRLQPAG